MEISITGAVTAGSYMAEPSKSKRQMREETERLVKEAIERKAVSVKQGNTRVETICGKCGASNRVSAPPGQTRVEYKCKECGHKQRTM
jgi:transposase-like protein